MFRPLPRLLTAMLLATAAHAAPAQAPAAPSADDPVVQAREALRRKDKAALQSARMAANTARHPLAMWAEYWELQNRLSEAQQPELETFWTRWGGTYVEDRLRNDWLLELGRRRDWANFRAEHPRFRMNDDREVACYALLVQYLDNPESPNLRASARAAWWAQRDLDDGCNLMARTMVDGKLLQPEDAWHEARLSLEANRPRAARAAAAMLSPALGDALGQIIDNPARYLLNRRAGGIDIRTQHELLLLALMRAAGNDPEYAAAQLRERNGFELPLTLAATAWAHAARQGALKQLPQAADWAREAWRQWDAASKPGQQPPWSDELLAWHVRAALRSPSAGAAGEAKRWQLVQRAIDAMPAAEQRDPAWLYWKARALQGLARPGTEGEAQRAQASTLLEAARAVPGFYGKLAAETLGAPQPQPPAPPPLAAAELEAPRANPGFNRALQLIALGLRSEGVREWNYTLRGLSERELLAAAQLACEREVWDRCINTSERTKAEVDFAQRFPTPFRDEIIARAKEAGLDPALLFGLIRQESRFIASARSSVGASGLMQLMPATAKHTAKKLGLAGFRPDSVTEPAVNLQLGAGYLRRVLEDFGGSAPMATAAYNAGPGRPRKWREGISPLEPAAWAETIPFNETRDYVKKVLANAVDYAALLGQPEATLKARLGPPIGPRVAGAPPPDRELP